MFPSDCLPENDQIYWVRVVDNRDPYEVNIALQLVMHPSLGPNRLGRSTKLFWDDPANYIRVPEMVILARCARGDVFLGDEQ